VRRRIRKLVISLDFIEDLLLLSRGCRAPVFALTRVYSHLFAEGYHNVSPQAYMA
jgi:hypothetical protein